MFNLGKRLIDAYKETKKSSILVYIILRALVIFSMVREILRGDFNRGISLYSILVIIYNTWIYKNKAKNHPTKFTRSNHIFIYI